MAFITMWRHGRRKCLLVLSEDRGRRYTLRVVEGDTILRAEAAKSGDHAFLMASMWETEEAESLYGAVAPV